MKLKESTTIKINPMSLFIILPFLLTLSIFLIIIFPKKIVIASSNIERPKVAISVQIKKGDTLWSIAGDYITEEYSNREEYINEIKKSNGISTDTIHEGAYIIVPHYTES